MAEWEPVIGLEIHVQLKTRTKMFCALRGRVLRPAELAHLPGLPRAPGRAAGAEPCSRSSGRSSSASRSAARSRRARSSTARTTSTPTTRRGTRSPSTTSRCARDGGSSSRSPTATARSGSCARTSRRTRRRTSTSAASAGGSAARRTRTSTSTAAARRCVEIVTEPDLHSADDGEALPAAAAADDRRARDLRRGDGEGHAARRRERLRPAGAGRDGAPHAHGAEEHELVQLHRARDRGRDRAADRGLGVGRRGRAADVRLRRRDGQAHAAALEGGGRGLPLLPRAGPRPGRAGDGARRAAARRGVRSCPARVSVGSRPSSTSSSPRGS